MKWNYKSTHSSLTYSLYSSEEINERPSQVQHCYAWPYTFQEISKKILSQL